MVGIDLDKFHLLFEMGDHTILIINNILKMLIFLVLFFLREHKSTKFFELAFQIVSILLFLKIRQVLSLLHGR